MKIGAIALAVAMMLIAVVIVFVINEGEQKTLILATTTSLYDTGLLQHLEARFEREYNVDLRIISAGTGMALKYGERGDVDVIIVHDRAREDNFIEAGYGVNRRCFAYNYFLIVGPPDDPANITGMKPEEAFRKIREEGNKRPNVVRFVSRGDDSGTHAREKMIWENAGCDYETLRKEAWYVESGSGMGATLMMADELSAYTLTDAGTFRAFADEIDLIPIVEQGDMLLNIYSVIAVNPERYPHVNYELAKKFINFLISEEGQRMIENFSVDGHQLFHPLGGDTDSSDAGRMFKTCGMMMR